MNREKAQSSKAETPHQETEVTEEAARKLSSILERRVARAERDVPGRLEQLRTAVQRFPGELTALLSSFESDLAAAGVASLEVYVLGGFAREATGEVTDEDTKMDTSIRPDTDIDVFILCTPKEGAVINPSRVPSPFSPLLHQWSSSELAPVVEIAFGVVGTKKTLRPNKPKLLLWRMVLPGAAQLEQSMG